MSRGDRSHDLPPAVVLGGSVNAVSVARGLGPRGVRVLLSMPAGRPELTTRHKHGALTFDAEEGPSSAWQRLLLSQDHGLDGSVLLACDDNALEFLAKNHDALAERYRLDDARPELTLDLIDKRRTHALARQAGVPTPRAWEGEQALDAGHVAETASFPVIVKPLHSHLFQRAFGTGGRKYLLAEDEAQLARHLEAMRTAELEVMVFEKCPGPDSLLASYYTYVDRDGRFLFDYTKRIVRRFPKNEGLASYHVTDLVPEVAELGKRFFRGIDLRGFGNVEFKRDPRDGQWRLIECNPRFTAAQELLRRSGLDAAWVVYSHVVGLPLPDTGRTRKGLHYWYPLNDLRAFLELRREGELSLGGWLASLCHRQVFPLLHPLDPAPALSGLWYRVRRRR